MIANHLNTPRTLDSGVSTLTQTEPSEIRERPILFSGAMVNAILDGKKSQTRRPIKPQPDSGSEAVITYPDTAGFTAGPVYGVRCPYGAPGDRLWVRETWAGDDLCGTVYRADHPNADIKAGDLDDGDQSLRQWRPSIFMPRWACRIELQVVSIGVERLQAISVNDIRDEGCFPYDHETWAGRWNAIYKENSWETNPWVWVIGFKRISVTAI